MGSVICSLMHGFIRYLGKSYMRSDVVGDEVLQQCCIVVGQAVLHHSQHIQGRVGEVIKPVATPVH